MVSVQTGPPPEIKSQLMRHAPRQTSPVGSSSPLPVPWAQVPESCGMHSQLALISVREEEAEFCKVRASYPEGGQPRIVDEDAPRRPVPPLGRWP